MSIPRRACTERFNREKTNLQITIKETNGLPTFFERNLIEHCIRMMQYNQNMTLYSHSRNNVVNAGVTKRILVYIQIRRLTPASKTATWWRHQMETFSALLAICAGNSPVLGEFPAQRPVTQSFDVFFDLRLKKRLSKQWWGWWFELWITIFYTLLRFQSRMTALHHCIDLAWRLYITMMTSKHPPIRRFPIP